ncbi:hypothetical protein PsorP6_014339 [Peronosclerospora sorghi]|uniref:Uncharacterized protein n=1 Tax=Peronosclerospora sorghi TaxID=230839 RepID=A0ACC0VHL1_9STRA|nr:hypothetical protein PsorP6_014339 [Peronosclerospora sorghi]
MIVKAWVLKRELPETDDNHVNYRTFGHAFVGQDTMSWQVLKYSCTWKLLKSSAELRNFDEQVRLLFGSKMQNIILPSRSLGQKLHQVHVNQSETERQERVESYDAYLQSLLRMSAFSSFGSDASALLDTFSDIFRHPASFRSLENESGMSMHLHDRRVVPWKSRARFERLYKEHLRVLQAQKEVARARTSQWGKGSNRCCQPHYRPQHGHCAGKTWNELANRKATGDAAHAARLAKTFSKRTCPATSVQDHIASIGQRLVIQAFET